MASIYEAYKPLRNMMRQCNVEASLIDIWQLYQHIMNNGRAPVQPGMAPYSVKDYLYPWDLPIVARELILNSTPDGNKRLNSRYSMQVVTNTIRQIENSTARERLAIEDVMRELHRISHRQFPWQQRSNLTGLLRYLKIFGSPDIASILEQRTGFSIREYFLLGMWLGGHLQTRFDINARQDFTGFGISREKSLNFFMSLSSNLTSLREEMKKHQKFDETWEYTWNPLESTPLISLDGKNPHRLYCPIPDFLLRRFSHGIFYDLVKAPGFDTAFGPSFENYIGEILQLVFLPPTFCILKEEPYSAGKDIHHGTDWILSDETASLFIECKTKRMTQAAKFSVSTPDLAGEIGIVADAVVQLYKNINDAQLGLTKWQPNGLPLFPLVVTLEDWFLFGPLPQETLKTSITDRMIKAKLDPVLLEVMPYAIASAREFERFVGIIKEVGIQPFFSGKSGDEYPRWMWEEYSREKFPSATRTNLQTLFNQDWLQVLPPEAMTGNRSAS